MTEVYYISDGEQSARMELDEALDNIEWSMDPDYPREQITRDIYEAVDMNGFWHGLLGVYNVAIVTVQKVKTMDERRLIAAMARKVARGGSAIIGEG
jgi:hypothetical protein